MSDCDEVDLVSEPSVFRGFLRHPNRVLQLFWQIGGFLGMKVQLGLNNNFFRHSTHAKFVLELKADSGSSSRGILVHQKRLQSLRVLEPLNFEWIAYRIDELCQR